MDTGGVMTGDLIGTDFVKTRAGTITRDGDGIITSISKSGGRTITITRDGDGLVSSVNDGTRTFSFSRNASDQITSWTVS